MAMANGNIILRSLLLSTSTPVPSASSSPIGSGSDESNEIDIDSVPPGTTIQTVDVELEGTSTTAATTTAIIDSESSESPVEEFFAKFTDEEASVGVSVPKYFQAIITLFTCALLLFITLAIIQQTKRLCRKSSCTGKQSVPLIRVNSGKDEDDGTECDSIITNGATPKKNNVDKSQDDGPIRPGGRHYDSYYSKQNAAASATWANAIGATTDKDNKVEEVKPVPVAPQNGNGPDATALKDEDLLKLKRVRFVRRTSGPFGEDAIDFARETYKTKDNYKESSVHAKKTVDPANPRSHSIKKPQQPPPIPPQPRPQ